MYVLLQGTIFCHFELKKWSFNFLTQNRFLSNVAQFLSFLVEKVIFFFNQKSFYGPQFRFLFISVRNSEISFFLPKIDFGPFWAHFLSFSSKKRTFDFLIKNRYFSSRVDFCHFWSKKWTFKFWSQNWFVACMVDFFHFSIKVNFSFHLVAILVIIW